MTPKQADKVIEMKEPVTVYNKCHDETFTALFLRRDRYNIYSADGIYDRKELQIVKQKLYRKGGDVYCLTALLS